MSDRAKPRSFPILPLAAAGALVTLTMAAALAGHLFGAHVEPDQTTAIAARDIRVADGAGGAVLVYDARDGQQIDTVTGQAGFLRGTLRALARERRIDGVGRQQSFRLTAWADGRLTLDDSATGSRVELEAFGPTNAAVFARFLPQQGSRS